MSSLWSSNGFAEEDGAALDAAAGEQLALSTGAG